MIGRRFDLFTLFGIKVRVDSSWLIVVAMFTWLLSNYFVARCTELSTTTLWAMGRAWVVGLFSSVVLHEFGHAIMARQVGVSSCHWRTHRV